jgi:biotin transport system substrate-specific component
MEYLSKILTTKSKTLNDLIVVFGGVILLFAASQIEIPLKPVPITLQTVSVMLIGLTYSPRKALETHLLWLGLGVAGLPVLAGLGSGIAHFSGPTAGYLVGFVLSTYVMALIKEKFELNSFLSDAMLCLMGTVIVFACGVIWLSQLIGNMNALMVGVVPFIIPGVVKAGILCSALQILRHFKAK